MLNNDAIGSSCEQDPGSAGSSPSLSTGRHNRQADIAARVKAVCTGLSAATVATLTHTHPETARRYLKGKSTPHPVFLAAICDSLGVSESWLLCGRGNPYRDAGPHCVQATLREGAVVVRTTMRRLLNKMTLVERMLKYPRLHGAGGPAPAYIEAPGGGAYGTETTREDSGTGSTETDHSLKLRQRA